MNTTLFLVVIIVLFVALVCAILFSINTRKNLIKKTTEAQHLKATYGPIIDLEGEIYSKGKKVELIKMFIESLQAKYDLDSKNLSEDYKTKKIDYENLVDELVLIEENHNDISYGLYKPHYDFGTSEHYKTELDKIWEAEKKLIRDEKAVIGSIKWKAGDNYAEVDKMTGIYSRLMLRAFNGECAAAIARVKWDNIEKMEARIEKSFEAINKLGESHQISITEDYFKLKLSELKLEFELQEKSHQEKEE